MLKCNNSFERIFNEASKEYTFLNEYSVIYDVNKTNIKIPNAIVMEGDEENINEFYICINVNNETTSVEIINLFIDSLSKIINEISDKNNIYAPYNSVKEYLTAIYKEINIVPDLNKNTEKQNYTNKRNLDGVFLRVQRNSKWENVCFSDLTEEEMNRELENKPEDWLKRLCIRLANVLKEIGEEYNIER